MASEQRGGSTQLGVRRTKLSKAVSVRPLETSKAPTGSLHPEEALILPSLPRSQSALNLGPDLSVASAQRPRPETHLRGGLSQAYRVGPLPCTLGTLPGLPGVAGLGQLLEEGGEARSSG